MLPCRICVGGMAMYRNETDKGQQLHIMSTKPRCLLNSDFTQPPQASLGPDDLQANEATVEWLKLRLSRPHGHVSHRRPICRCPLCTVIGRRDPKMKFRLLPPQRQLCTTVWCFSAEGQQFFLAVAGSPRSFQPHCSKAESQAEACCLIFPNVFSITNTAKPRGLSDADGRGDT